MTNNIIDFPILRSKFYGILDETKGPLASIALRSMTLNAEKRENITINEILRDELGLLAKKSSNIFEKMQEAKLENLSEIEENRQLYFDYIRYYEEFILLTARLVQELSLPNNSISSSKVIFKLIYDGYLSRDSNFHFIMEQSHPNIIGLMGINVINGAGCCRHVSDIHKKIFDNLNLFDIELPGVKDKLISLNGAFHVLPNHIINLIKFNNKYYLHDLSEETIGYFENSFTLKSYQENLNYRFYYKPTINMLLQNLSQEEVISKIIEFQEDSHKLPISPKELNEILAETENRFNQSTSLLSDFQLEKKKYIKKIIPPYTK